ncbi:hypothetical protein [Jiella marina]|uniref:hypothetical protein n=1 Tax=Jiella sp. LLJ827 TaxID=2917712 RepID=UPI0021014D33|nr:hypothetical protein [Jiella sp. LLJ827]MCQ0986356.1 hypothetical protein [Jiella sp. LLJ827]
MPLSSAAASCIRRAILALVFASSAFHLLPAFANDDPAYWRDEIAKARAEYQRLVDIGFSKGTFAIGTALNEIDIDIHTCHVLSIMLGKEHLTQRLVAPQEKDPEAEPGFDELVEAQSLDNWANIAEEQIERTPSERSRAWNLDCVGQFAIPADEYIREDQRRAVVVAEGETIRVLGDVEQGFFDELKAAIDTNPQVKQIALGSAGGNVGEAVRAGRYIREKGLETVLYNACESACSLVFLGGVERQIWRPYPEMGFHKVASGGVAIPDDHQAYDLIRAYAKEMGVDGRFVVDAMRKADVRDMYHPEMPALCSANVATLVHRWCFGEPPQASSPARTDDQPVADDLSATSAAAPTAQVDAVCAQIAARHRQLAERASSASEQTGLAGAQTAMLRAFERMLQERGC